MHMRAGDLAAKRMERGAIRATQPTTVVPDLMAPARTFPLFSLDLVAEGHDARVAHHVDKHRALHEVPVLLVLEQDAASGSPRPTT